MQYEEILKENIDNKELHKKCNHEPDGVKMIFQRCKTCGKWIPIADPEWIAKHGHEGRAWG